MPPKVPYYAGFTPSSPLASRIKQANRREGGRAERLLGQALWRAGLRYRKHPPGLPGRPDFVLAGARVCVFCDGDFWHGRDWDALRERLARRANPAYWLAKIGRNVERDREQTALLTALGWLVVRLWETDVLRDPEAAARQVRTLVDERRPPARAASAVSEGDRQGGADAADVLARPRSADPGERPGRPV